MIATLLTLCLAAGAAPRLELLGNATTPGTRILLRDVVARSAALAPDLLDRDLGRAPSPGFARRIERAQIEALVAAEGGAIEWSGAEEVAIVAETRTVDGPSLLAKARELLDGSGLLQPGTRVEVERDPAEVSVPKGRQGVQLQAAFKGAPRGRGTVLVQVDVLVDGALARTASVAFRLRTFAPVAVLEVELQKGVPLQPEHVGATIVETTTLGTVPPSSADALVGLVAKRNLRAGSTLAISDFEPPVLVRRNDSVTLVFQKGSLRVEAFGVARGDGALGDAVKVENLATKKQLTGRVVGAGVVAMNP